MLKPRLAYSALALLALGCAASDGSDPLEGLGEASLPLTATTATGVVYRLNKATFVITDTSCKRVVATVKTDPNQAIQDVSLKAGTYTIKLVDGWTLQRKVGTAWQDTTGKLTAQPTGTFKIKSRETTALKYAFGFGTTAAPASTSLSTLSGLSKPGCNGTARISITVTDEVPALDCSLYVSKISALAAHTIACTGTLDPSQYSMSDGFLLRNFETCETDDPDALASIDGILSLQYPRPDLDQFPEAAAAVQRNQAFTSECIAKAWDKWQAANSGLDVCPTWTKISESNSPDNADQMGSLIASLPPPTTDPDTFETTVPPTPATVVQQEKLGQLYQVALPDGSAPNCGDAARCAVACAGGFTGFVLNTDGNVVVTDPAYWELSNKYADGQDPFFSAGYYHAMADYGPVPGDQFGHAQRAKQTSDGVPGEPCTYYLDGKRFFTTLILSTNTTGSVSWCRPPSTVILQ